MNQDEFNDGCLKLMLHLRKLLQLTAVSPQTDIFCGICLPHPFCYLILLSGTDADLEDTSQRSCNVYGVLTSVSCESSPYYSPRSLEKLAGCYSEEEARDGVVS